MLATVLTAMVRMGRERQYLIPILYYYNIICILLFTQRRQSVLRRIIPTAAHNLLTGRRHTAAPHTRLRVDSLHVERAAAAPQQQPS